MAGGREHESHLRPLFIRHLTLKQAFIRVILIKVTYKIQAEADSL